MDPNNKTDDTTPTEDTVDPATQPVVNPTPDSTPGVPPVFTPAPTVEPSAPTPAPVDPTPTPAEIVPTAATSPTAAPITPPLTPPASNDTSSPFFTQADDPTQGAAPAAPAAPVIAAAAPLASTTPGAPKPSNTKKIILIAGIAGGAMLLAIVGVVLFLLLTIVSKDDYRAAAAQLNAVSSADSKLSSDASSLGYSVGDSDDSTFNDDLKQAEDSIASIKSENAELGKLKAVKVGEGAKLYKTFNEKLNAYTEYASGLVTSVKNLRPALVICNGIGDAEDPAARVASLKSCSSSLGEVSDIPNAEFKTFVDVLKTSYAEYATTYEQMSALTNPYGSQYDQYKTLRDKLYAIQETIGTASDTFSESLEKRDDTLSVKDSAEALNDFLRDNQK